MTKIDAMQLLRDKCAEIGQAAVAKATGKSPSAINQLLHGNYKAEPDTILDLVVEQFGGLSVKCPHLGDIPLYRCAEEKRKPFDLVSSGYVRQRKACRACERGGKP